MLLNDSREEGGVRSGEGGLLWVWGSWATSAEVHTKRLPAALRSTETLSFSAVIAIFSHPSAHLFPSLDFVSQFNRSCIFALFHHLTIISSPSSAMHTYFHSASRHRYRRHSRKPAATWEERLGARLRCTARLSNPFNEIGKVVSFQKVPAWPRKKGCQPSF